MFSPNYIIQGTIMAKQVDIAWVYTNRCGNHMKETGITNHWGGGEVTNHKLVHVLWHQIKNQANH